MVEETDISVVSGSRSRVNLTLESGSEVEVTVHKLDDNGSSLPGRVLRFSNPARHTPVLFGKLNFDHVNWAVVLIGAALVIYLVSRFIGLDSFPIYFFSDEAVQTVRAADLITNDFYGEGNEFLPTYLINGGQYNLSTSVYIQILPTLIFGKSIWVTRGVCVLFTLFAVFGVALAAKNVFKSQYPWLYILILSTIPAWFLHSRTAFETVLATSFFAAFLYCYMMYRQGRVGYLYAAAVFGALTFYSYSPAQMVMAVTALALLFSDLRYHWQKRVPVLIAAGICAVFSIPYIRFLINHPTENARHLLILNSYLIKSTPVWQKISTYFSLYWQNINPAYWFFPNDVDIVRHIMKGYGNLGWWLLPFVLLGLVNAILHIKESQYRLVLIALLAAPTGAALTGQGVTRVMFLIIPAAMLAGLGVDQLINWLKRIRVNPAIPAGVLLATLIGLNGYMVYDTMTNAPTWFQDYTLTGMQYGARQVFSAALQYMKDHPQDKLIISSQWTNGADTLGRFFLDKPLPYAMGSIERWLDKQMPLDDTYTFVVIPEEMDLIKANPKFKSLQVLQTISYPNGVIGFYFVKVAYADNIAQILEQESEARHMLITDTITLADGTEVVFKHPEFDMGKPADAFDGNPVSVIRTKEANPMDLVLDFPVPPTYTGITVRVGGSPTDVSMQAFPADGIAAIEFSQHLPVSGDNRDVTFPFGKPTTVSEIKISVKNSESGEPDHVHVYEITLLK